MLIQIGGPPVGDWIDPAGVDVLGVVVENGYHLRVTMKSGWQMKCPMSGVKDIAEAQKWRDTIAEEVNDAVTKKETIGGTTR